MRRKSTGRWGAQATAAAAGSLLLATVAMVIGAPLWAVAAIALLGLALTLTVLLRSRRAATASPTRVRADDLATRDAVLHRLRPLAPRPTARPPADQPRPMLWERPTRTRRAG
jgi:hypothetical protein